MATKKISALTAASAANLTDLLEKVNDPAGTPASQKLTIQQLVTLLAAQFSLTQGVKSYRALMSQTKTELTGGSLVVGHQYKIMSYNGTDDFANVGAAANEAGQIFVATDTTPTDWSSGSTLLDIDLSAPSVIVLENTLGGAIVWTWNAPGEYIGTLSGAFTADKTFPRSYTWHESAADFTDFLTVERTSANAIKVRAFNAVQTGLADDTLNKTPIELIVFP